MRKRLLGSTAAVVLCAAVLMLGQVLVGQAPAGQNGRGGRGGARGRGGFGGRGRGAAPVPGGPVDRMPDGKPNLTGFWTSSTRTDIESARGGIIVDPPGNMIPYNAEWRAKAEDEKAHHMFNEPEAHCRPGGVPRNFGLQLGFQLVQGENHLAFAWDTVGATRLIYFDQGRKHVPTAARMHQGDSVGHWEGDVLVVDTTSQLGGMWFDVSGHLHSDQLHVVERFNPVDSNNIQYEAVVEDPVALTQPFKLTDNFRRNLSVPAGFRGRPSGYEQTETACVEGERDLNLYTQSGGGFAEEGTPGENAPPGTISEGRGRGGRGGGRGGFGGRGGPGAPNGERGQQ